MLLSNNTSTTNETWCDSDHEFGIQVLSALKILLIFTSILIIVGNTLVLLATWRKRSLHQPNKYFVACLAVADLLVGVIIGPVSVYGLGVDDKSLLDISSIHLCRFTVWTDTSTVIASVYTLTFISFDRYPKISKPLQYRSRMTTSKSLKIISIIWLISNAFATYAVTPDSGSTGFLADGGDLCTDYHRGTKRRVVKGGGGGHNPISHRLKKTGLNHHVWLCVLHVAEVVSYLHGYLT